MRHRLTRCGGWRIINLWLLRQETRWASLVGGFFVACKLRLTCASQGSYKFLGLSLGTRISSFLGLNIRVTDPMKPDQKSSDKPLQCVMYRVTILA